MNSSKDVKPGKFETQKIIAELKAARADTAFRTTASGNSEIFGKQRAGRNVSGMQNIGEKERAIAIERSSSVLKTFVRGIDDRRQALEMLQSRVVPPTPPIGPAKPTPIYTVLDTPFLIWPTHGMELLDSNLIPYGSFGKISVDPDSSGSTELGFYFLWENPTKQSVVINVYGYLAFNGLISAWGIEEPDQMSSDHHLECSGSGSMGIDAYLRTYRWWDQPPTEPLPEPDQFKHVDAVSDLDINVGCGASKNVVQGVDPRYTLFQVIPSPNGVAVIEVAAHFYYQANSTDAKSSADFNSGDFQIMCPYVLIEVVA
jgi:hypothetical protein